MIPLIYIRELDGTNSEITSKIFDAVMICNGHFWDQVKPNIPGMEKFKGVTMHSGDYRSFQPYVGKRVVIVGCSHSAGNNHKLGAGVPRGRGGARGNLSEAPD